MSSAGGTPGALMIVAVAALVGFGAIYVTFGRKDNAEPPSAPKKADIVTLVDVPAGKTGKMAAFVRKKTPEAVPEISFNDATGSPRKLSDFKGRAILLNLWATWCAPCREEMPALNRLQEQLGSDTFEVVALSLDRQGAPASQKFLDEVKASALRLYVDPTAKQGLALKIVGMPTTILIDKKGLEVGRLSGPAEWDSAEAKALIDEAMR